MANVIIQGAIYQDVPSIKVQNADPISGPTWIEYKEKPDLKAMLLRPDAELVQTYSHDSFVVEDDKITIPAYTTTATTVIAATELTPTYTLDYANYNYYILERFLTIPSYNIDSVAKGREEYHFSSCLYEVADVEGSTFKTLVNGKIYTSRTVVMSGQSCIRQLYWSGSTAIGMYTATTYGAVQVATAPAISNGVVTVTAPEFRMRGSSTYLSSTYWGALTDIRRQYVIEIWRAPKGNLNIDGWGHSHQMLHIANCINDNNCKLT